MSTDRETAWLMTGGVMFLVAEDRKRMREEIERALASARQEEREACAALAESYAPDPTVGCDPVTTLTAEVYAQKHRTARTVAAAIRARTTEGE